MFLNWACCNMGWMSLCGHRVTLHLVAFLISIPLCAVHRMNFFVMTSAIATVVIFVTSTPDSPVNVIMGYQFADITSIGVSSTANYFRFLNFPEFFGVTCYAIEGIGLIFPIRSSMKEHHGFRWTFHIVAALIVIWYFLFGMTGALVAER